MAPGPRRRRHLHVRRRPPCRRAPTRPRSPSTKPGTRTTARAACRTARQHRLHRPDERRGSHLHLRRRDPRPDGQRRPRRRQQRRVGRARARLARATCTAPPAARSRPARRSRCGSAPSTTTCTAVSVRLYCARAGRPADRADGAGRGRHRLLRGSPRRRAVRLLADDAARRLGRGQPVVPLHRQRRHRHRLLRRQHAGARRRHRLDDGGRRSTQSGRSWSTSPASRRRRGRPTR